MATAAEQKEMINEMAKTGLHFGHTTSNWNPKMKKYIFMQKAGIYILDLRKTVKLLEESTDFIKETVKNGNQVLFFGIKDGLKDIVEAEAKRVNMPYVTNRWPGGLLTNFTTISKSLDRLKELEEITASEVSDSRYTKKELLLLTREKVKLESVLGGVRNMKGTPSAIFVVGMRKNISKNVLAIDEARKLGVPIIAIVDTNCDPELVEFPIPGNDDSTKSVKYITAKIADAVAAGILAREERTAAKDTKSGDTAPAAAPLAAWERELLGEEKLSEV
ncbi:MAG: 30S ribosomal protein S2 [Bifidobacteriaceae bacterium]|nr:30S ribosomal protein S2 [Bifidobacteriaceae bacterium]